MKEYSRINRFLEIPREVVTGIPKVTITGFDEILIENFKGIQNKEYDLTPTVVAVLGNNGTGKTSFLDAFNRVYTGLLADIHARTGASTAVIEAYLDNGARISHIRKTQKVLKNPVTEHRLDGRKKLWTK